MNWQFLARRNGRTLSKGGRCISAIRSNTFSHCSRRLQGPVNRLRRTHLSICSSSIRKASGHYAGTSRSRLMRRGLADFANVPRSHPASTKRYVKHVELVLSEELLSTMSRAADTVLQQPTLHLNTRTNDEGKERHRNKFSSVNSAKNEARNLNLKKRHEANKINPQMKRIREIREGLPMNQHRAQVLSLVNQNPFSIIVGATGSGKSTQVPQIILEDAIERGDGSSISIICTQPRRIAATSIAHRVAAERNEDLGDTVGYFMRFENKLTKSTGSIHYCTTGSLLRKLHNSPEYLDNVSHIVLDEVHERSIEVDMAMLVLKKQLEKRVKAGQSAPRIVIMSATLDEALFTNYFGQADADGAKQKCPMISVPGRTFPVTSFYLENVLTQLKRSYTPEQLKPLLNDKLSADYVIREQQFMKQATTQGSAEPEHEQSKSPTPVEDGLVPTNLIATTVAHIVRSSKSGAILVFCPGWREILNVKAFLEAGILGVNFSDRTKFKIYSVHSEHIESQTELFSTEAPGSRKIILATNIAETSITIPEVQYVVDCGKFRQDRYDQEERTSELKCTWISKSSSDQRAGRAGRVQSGKYYALFSKSRYQSLGKAIPNILRTDLQNICLDVKARSPESSIKSFLAGAIDPPHPDTLNTAIQSLRDIDALTQDEQITPLGTLLASLPLHPSMGRMIVLGIVFRCLDPMLMLCASSTTQKLFIRPLGQEREASLAHRSFDNGYNSDPVRFVVAFTAARHLQAQNRDEYEEFMKHKYLSTKVFENIQRVMTQIKGILAKESLLPWRTSARDPDMNENSSNFALIRALSIAAHRGNIARRDSPFGFQIRTGDRAFMMRSSANFPIRMALNDEGSLEFPQDAIISYGGVGKQDGDQLTLRNTTLISPVAAALFASELEIDGDGKTLTINKWLRLHVKSGPGLPAEEDISTIILLFREAWDQILSSAFSRLSGGRYPINYVQQQAFVDALMKVVSRDFGDEDVRRILDGVKMDAVRKAKQQEISEARAAREALEVERLERLKGHLDQAYTSS